MYALIVVRRMLRRARQQHSYSPVREDWLWYALLPVGAYFLLVVTAILLPESPETALFGAGAAMVLLLFVGIHNAWDTVTYIAVVRFQSDDDRQNESTKQTERME
jgi:hypothetical protein